MPISPKQAPLYGGGGNCPLCARPGAMCVCTPAALRFEITQLRDKLMQLEAREIGILAALYKSAPNEVAHLCDEALDRSGKLLGLVRTEASNIRVVKVRSPNATRSVCPQCSQEAIRSSTRIQHEDSRIIVTWECPERHKWETGVI